MIKILDFAALSSYVYKDPVTNRKNFTSFVYKQMISAEKFTQIAFPENNIFYEIIIDPHIQQHSNNPFYASLFVKVLDKKPIAAILAVRGTDNLSNEIQDIETWGEHVLGIENKLKTMPDYMGPALRFCFKVNNYCRQQLQLPQNKVYITGHSLGGAIASLLRCKNKMPNQAITFNAPGVRNMPGVDGNIKGILNVRARYDLVSVIDEPVGPYWDVDVPEKEAEAKHLFQLYNTEHNKTFENHAGLWEKLKYKLDMGVDAVEAASAQHSIFNLYSALKHQNSLGIARRSFMSLALGAETSNFVYAAI